MNEIREIIKKVGEHEDKLKSLSLDSLTKKVNQLIEEMKGKADKGEIMRLESEKAEKISVDIEFKKIWKEIESLKSWSEQMDELIRK